MHKLYNFGEKGRRKKKSTCKDSHLQAKKTGILKPFEKLDSKISKIVEKMKDGKRNRKNGSKKNVQERQKT